MTIQEMVWGDVFKIEGDSIYWTLGRCYTDTCQIHSEMSIGPEGSRLSKWVPTSTPVTQKKIRTTRRNR